ncbi:MAG: hypothetical protein VW268_01060 [Rhodospirillaceae bacterium]
MINRIFAPLSIIMLFAFMAVILIYVPRVDLAIITLSICCLAAYDFWRWFREGGEEEENASISQPKD